MQAALIIKNKGKITKMGLSLEQLDFYKLQLGYLSEFKYLCFLSTHYKIMEEQLKELSISNSKNGAEYQSIIFNSINSFYTNEQLWKHFLSRYKKNINIFPNGYGNDKNKKEIKSIIDIERSKIYDSSYEFLVVDALRNYAQHVAPPITDFEFPENYVKPMMSIRELLKYKKLSVSARKEIVKHEKEIFIDLIPVILTAFNELDKLNNFAFKEVINTFFLELTLACQNIENLVSLENDFACIAWDNDELDMDDYYKVEHITIPLIEIKNLKLNGFIKYIN